MRFLVAGVDHGLFRGGVPVIERAHPDPQGLRGCAYAVRDPFDSDEVTAEPAVIIEVAFVHGS